MHGPETAGVPEPHLSLAIVTRLVTRTTEDDGQHDAKNKAAVRTLRQFRTAVRHDPKAARWMVCT